MSSTISPRHAAALDYAASGIPVFPCYPGSKQPATANGQHDASTDTETINMWWAEADYNLAFCPASAGWSIVDLDPGGEDEWTALLVQHGQPQSTFTVRTPRGGLHIYYEGEVASSQHRLAPHIDTRGISASGRATYALVPPSVIDGREYIVEVDTDVAPVPQWLPALCAMPNVTARATGEVERDAPQAIARAVAYLKALPPVTEGQGSDHAAFSAAAALRDLGLSIEKSHETMMEHFTCEPLDSDWLMWKIENAYRYAQNEEGADAVGSPSATFATILGIPAANETPTVVAAPRGWFDDWDQQNNTAPPRWLIPELIPDEATVLLYGATGSYKSYIALDIALAVASGLPTCGITPERSGPVFYGAAEGRIGLKTSRRNAWLLGRGVTGPFPLYIGPQPRLTVQGHLDAFCEAIEEARARRRIGLVILDTVAKVMAGLSENDASDAGIMVQASDRIKDQFRCSVLCLHHDGKDEGKGARGSSAFAAGFDTILSVKAEKAAKVVALKAVQHKDADERGEPWYLEGKAIAGDLVFQPITPQEYLAMTQVDDVMSPRTIGAALAALGAFGIERAVTSIVLASHLLAHSATSAETVSIDVGRLSKSLARASRDRLSGYAELSGRDVVWCLPATNGG